MDLIEILWRQDIDLGIGREMFDSSLRRELEKEQEIEQKKVQEADSQHVKDEQPAESSTNEGSEQQVQYVVDGETGTLSSPLSRCAQLSIWVPSSVAPNFFYIVNNIKWFACFCW